jgi:hypothetical protein
LTAVIECHHWISVWARAGADMAASAANEHETSNFNFMTTP